MKIDPYPARQVVIDKDKMPSLPWTIWFRNVSKNLVDACRVFEKDNYTYGINNNILTIVYSGNGNESLSLPYPIAVDTILTYWYYDDLELIWKSTILDLIKGQESINLPSKQIKINCQIIVEQRNK